MSYLISQSQILKKHSILIAVSVASIMFVYFRCTGNPIGDNNITPRPDQISGQVQLDNNGQPERVYVWLEGFDVGTFTEFFLTLTRRAGSFMMSDNTGSPDERPAHDVFIFPFERGKYEVINKS